MALGDGELTLVAILVIFYFLMLLLLLRWPITLIKIIGKTKCNVHVRITDVNRLITRKHSSRMRTDRAVTMMSRID